MSDCYGSDASKQTTIVVLNADNETPESIPVASSDGATEVESSANDFTTIFNPLHDGDPEFQVIKITLDGAGSTDEDGDDLDYVWTSVDENGMPLNLSSNGLNDNIFNLCDEDNDEDLYDCQTIDFIADSVGTYLFKLTVTDTYGSEHNETITIIQMKSQTRIL